MKQSFTGSKGFTLVEVLVTVVIFSVGLLGLAGLQATGIKLNHSSLLRSQATLLAYDIIDCMRANQGSSKANLPDYAIAMNASPPSTATNQADQDVMDWIGTLSQSLPSGDGSITLNGSRATVVVQWDDIRNPNVPVKSMTVVSDI
ncbi:MAG: type IV pilus modification protein PilV [Gammaproteobacteria bacterium]|nr:type IV pilus modification protein PilV [Gammaproteobacteria bacterium]